tara:strand:+ start:252 stop:467 length:216 start_codon:yes stop_codon:yes gene_type:complete
MGVKMPGTRYKLIGECVVFIVKSPDAILRRILSELKQVKKIRKKIKKSKRRTAKQIAATKKLIRFNKQRRR